MDRCTENRHVGRRSHLSPKDTLAEVTFPSHNAAEYIEHAQLLAMDYPNMLTAVAVRNNVQKSTNHANGHTTQCKKAGTIIQLFNKLDKVERFS